jgi:hypothetical protein
VNQRLAAFRAAVEKVLPLVQSAATLNDPVPMPRAVTSLCRFLRQLTGATDAALLVRHVSAHDNPGAADVYQVYDAEGAPMEGDLVPFARSVAATAISFGQPCVMNDLAAAGTVELQPFERGRGSLLAAPLAAGPGVHAVLELFDRPGGFRDEDRRLASAGAEIGAELLRRDLTERQMRRTLFDAVEAALDVTRLTADGPAPQPEEALPAAVLDSLRHGLASDRTASVGADAALRLADAVRVLAERHGPPAVEHCIQLVESVRRLMDGMT